MTPRVPLRARLALLLALGAGAIAAVLAGAALLIVERTLEQRIDERLARLHAAAERLLAAHERELPGRLAALEDRLRGEAAGVLERLLSLPRSGTVPAELRALAGRWMGSAGLDVLVLLDREGTVLSSAPWYERAGTVATELLAFPDGEPVRVRVPVERGELPVVALRHTIRVGSAELHLFGGTRLDRTFVEAAALGEAALLYDPDGTLRAVGGRGDALADGPDTATLARLGSPARGTPPPAAAAERLSDAAGGAWSAVALPLTGHDGAPLGVLVQAVDRSGQQRLTAQLRRSFLALGVGAVLLAALSGVWIAGSVTRPVAALVRSVDAIARGEADYTFPRQADHELDELVASFSRLQRSLDEQQRRALAAERVAAWREAARRVAHEIKNPLAPIRLTVENMLRARRQAPAHFDEVFAEGTRTILEEVDQLRRMVDEFAEFARLPEPRPESADIEALVDGVVALFASEPGLAVRRARATELPRAQVDPDQLSRALKNVVQNAIEAIHDAPGRHGSLSIETGVEDGMISIEVSDDGPGFSERALEHLFEPYFTTKPEGTGLGMAITHRILTEHGGTVRAGNRPGGGARVRLQFPPVFRRPGAGAGGGTGERAAR